MITHRTNDIFYITILQWDALNDNDLFVCLCTVFIFLSFYMYIWYYITLLLSTMLLSYSVRNDEIKMFNQCIRNSIVNISTMGTSLLVRWQVDIESGSRLFQFLLRRLWWSHPPPGVFSYHYVYHNINCAACNPIITIDDTSWFCVIFIMMAPLIILLHG